MSRLIAFASRTVGLFILLAAGWFAFLFASGDQLVECDYADCGTIGEFANAHTVQLLWAFLAVSLAVSGALHLAGADWAVRRSGMRRDRTKPHPS